VHVWPSLSLYIYTQRERKKKPTHARTNQTHARFNYHDDDDAHTARMRAVRHDGSNFYARKDRNIYLYIYILLR